MFGSHLSIAGGLHHALDEARRLDMDCVQVFTKNQRQWRVKPLSNDAVRTWFEHQHDTGITDVVSHDSYLINLASPDAGNLSKSLALFREELLRCEALKIPSLVTHPGAYLRGDEDEGLRRIAKSLDRVHADLPGLKTVTLLEVTAGQGTTLGYRFAHLARIIEMVGEPDRLAVCLDTAHLLEAGYDLTSAQGCRAMVAELDDVLGVELVRAIHVNDSKTPRGSRVDRHEHIGHGHVSLDAFKVIVNHSHFKKIPKILETPKQDAPDGRPWDVVNIETLKSLVRRRPKRKAAKRPPARRRK